MEDHKSRKWKHFMWFLVIGGYILEAEAAVFFLFILLPAAIFSNPWWTGAVLTGLTGGVGICLHLIVYHFGKK